MKTVNYHQMTVITRTKLLEVEDDADMEAVSEQAKLMTNLHGWDDVGDSRINEWYVVLDEKVEIPRFGNPLSEPD